MNDRVVMVLHINRFDEQKKRRAPKEQLPSPIGSAGVGNTPAISNSEGSSLK